MSVYDHAYFESLYAKHADPWDFAGSAYEARKYDATLAALPRAHYASALELGCSIGILTARLAMRAASVVALDTSEQALAQASQRLVDAPHVSLLRSHLPDGDWERPYDLIVLSEVLYYLDDDALDRLTARLRHTALPGADIVAVHWTGKTDYPQTADRAIDRFESAFPGLISQQRKRTRHYRLDVWRTP